MTAAAWPTDPAAFFLEALPARAQAHAGELGRHTSVGSLAFRFEPGGLSFSLRLVQGELVVAAGEPEDALLSVTTTPATFAMLVERVLPEAEGAAAKRNRGDLVRSVLARESGRATELRALGGDIVFVLTGGATKDRIVLAPGASTAAPSRNCTLRASLADVIELVAGRLQPIQLMMSGQLVIEGDAGLVMKLVGLFT